MPGQIVSAAQLIGELWGAELVTEHISTSPGWADHHDPWPFLNEDLGHHVEKLINTSTGILKPSTTTRHPPAPYCRQLPHATCSSTEMTSRSPTSTTVHVEITATATGGDS